METLENLLAGKVEELGNSFIIYATLEHSNQIYAVSGMIEESTVAMMLHFPHLKGVKSKLTLRDIRATEKRGVTVIDAGYWYNRDQAIDRVNSGITAYVRRYLESEKSRQSDLAERPTKYIPAERDILPLSDEELPRNGCLQVKV